MVGNISILKLVYQWILLIITTNKIADSRWSRLLFQSEFFFKYLMLSTYFIENSDWKSWNGGSLWYFFGYFSTFLIGIPEEFQKNYEDYSQVQVSIKRASSHLYFRLIRRLKFRVMTDETKIHEGARSCVLPKKQTKGFRPDF